MIRVWVSPLGRVVDRMMWLWLGAQIWNIWGKLHVRTIQILICTCVKTKILNTRPDLRHLNEVEGQFGAILCPNSNNTQSEAEIEASNWNYSGTSLKFTSNAEIEAAIRIFAGLPNPPLLSGVREERIPLKSGVNCLNLEGYDPISESLKVVNGDGSSSMVDLKETVKEVVREAVRK
ncbi:hypothetical protein HanOQP8_Chr16g0640791 [Helianthus annuus]|nr:hypothetical protein HanLR1_Chr16g0645501 [Helianthus annuus]KAJ0646949.1 hypothetical protein HanOQP8_Chr16g0640791 [Helianthus annuus]